MRVDNRILRYCQSHHDNIIRYRVIQEFKPLVLRLALSWSRRYRTVDIEDLLAEGNLALHRCLEIYRPKKGAFGFAAYSKLAISRRMERHVSRFFKSVRWPENKLSSALEDEGGLL